MSHGLRGSVLAILAFALVSSTPLRATEYFFDDFDAYISDEDLKDGGGWLPVDENTPLETATWTVLNPGGRANPPSLDGTPSNATFIISDSDAASGDNPSGTGMSHDIWSPTFNCSGATVVWLHADVSAQLNNNGQCVFDVDVSSDDGATWANVFRRVAPSRAVDPVPTTTNADGYYGRLDVDISAQAAGKASVRIRFRHFEPSDDWWIAVDNVLVDDQPVLTGAANLLLEGFGAGIPDSWTVVSKVDPPNAGGLSWSVEDPCRRSVTKYNNGNFPYLGGRGIHRLDEGYALMDSDCDPDGAAEDEYLISPAVDCSRATAVFLQYKSEADVSTGATMEVLVSTDGGNTFESTPIFSYNLGAALDSFEEPFYAERTFSVPSAVGKANVAFAFRLASGAGDAGWWAVDDVKVSANGPGFNVRDCANRELTDTGYNAATKSVGLKWRTLAGDQGFRILRNGAQLGGDLVATATSFTDTAPTPGVQSTYTLQSLVGGNVEFECTSSAITAYTCPENLVCCVDQAARSVKLSWAGGTNLAGNGFTISRNGTAIATVPFTATTYTDAGVPSDGIQTYTLAIDGPAGQCALLPLSCQAPIVSGVIFYDDFNCYGSDEDLAAAGWEVQEIGEPSEIQAYWTTLNLGGREPPPAPDGRPTGGKFLISDSDASGGDDGQGSGRSHDILTPVMNCTGKSVVWAHMAMSLVLNNNGVCVFDLDVTTDNGATYTNVFRRVAPSRSVDPLPLADIPDGLENGPQVGNADGFLGTLHVDLSEVAANKPSVRLRLRQFEPSDDWWMSVDDVIVDSTPAPRGSKTLLGPEDFGADLPADWTADSVDGIAPWRTVDSCNISLLNATGGLFPDSFGGNGLHHFDEKFAFVALDEGCTTPAGTETLLTPVIDCTNATAVYLHVKSALTVTDAGAEILLSTDGGSTFEAAPVFSYNAGSGMLRDSGNPETIYNEHSFVVPGAIGKSNVAFAFRYTNTSARTAFWAIDDVEVTGEVTITAPQFHRGDADNNGELQLTDAVRILGFLFLGGAAPTCLDAADADDNGQLQLTDAVRILGYLFLGQAPPATPGPPGEACGPDAAQEDPDLGCETYTSC